MARKLSRRELLKFTGGAVAGTLFTPLPWKLIDDIAIWTQTSSLVPKLTRGPVTARAAACTLCPAGCAVRLSLVAGLPYSVLPASRGPAGPPAICPLGLAAHHLAGHPLRLRAPMARTGEGASRHPVDRAAAVAALASELSGRVSGRKRDRVAFLDGRPGRAVSVLYRALMARVPGGVYVPAVPPEERTLQDLRGRLDPAPEELGVDLDAASAILGFGAPLLEGWGGPPASACLTSRRCGEGGPLTILQAEPRASGTALRADRWLQIRPGSEAALALAIADVLAHDPGRAGRLGEAAGSGALSRLATAGVAAAATGLSQASIRETAAILAAGRSVAIGGGNAGGGPLPQGTETALSMLNVLLGALEPGGVVRPRRALPRPGSLRDEDLAPPARLEDLPDGSVGVLIVDAPSWSTALPAEILDRKLASTRRLVLSFSPYLIGHATLADLVVPAPAWLEAIEEVPTPPAAPRASLALSPALLPAPPGAADPVSFLRDAAAAAGIDLPGAGDSAALIAERVEAILAASRGRLTARSGADPAPLASFASAAALSKELIAGTLWEDERREWPDGAAPRMAAPSVADLDLLASRVAPPARLPEAYPLLLVPFGRTGLSGEGPVPPLLAKLHRESDLREAGATIHLNPRTAAACGVRDGAAVRIETREGRLEAIAVCDPLLTPGVLFAAAGPDPEQLGEPGPRASRVLDLCVAGCEEGRWAAPARLREA